MRHLDAIVEASKQPERQPTRAETDAFISASMEARALRDMLRMVHAIRPVYTREP